MRRFCIISTIVIIFGLLLSALASSADYTFREKGISNSAYDEAVAEQQHMAGVKKWVMIFGSMAAPAFLYLLILAISGGGVFSENIESVLTKISLLILMVAILLFLYYLSENRIFLLLLPVAVAGLLLAFAGQSVRRLYMKKFAKPAAPDLWICKKCGTENHVINAECYKCHSRRAG